MRFVARFCEDIAVLRESLLAEKKLREFERSESAAADATKRSYIGQLQATLAAVQAELLEKTRLSEEASARINSANDNSVNNNRGSQLHPRTE